jgi:nicotinate-nucleotide adenylyltransferase
MPEPHYTIRTLDALKEREPENSFTFIMGADNLADIRRWKDYGRILREYGAAVYPREGIDLDAVEADLLKEDKEFKITVVNAPMVDISSSEIREGIAAGKDMSSFLM